jgi:hypothetical protein
VAEGAGLLPDALQFGQRLPTGLFQDGGPFLVYPGQPLPEFFGQALRLGAGGVGLIAGARRLQAQTVQVGQQALRLAVLGSDERLGPTDDLLIQPQPPGDSQRVGAAGDADRQAVRGPQRLRIKFHAGVLDAGGQLGVRLQFRVVGGDEGDRAPLPEGLQERPRQRRPLSRVRPRPQFVQQDQRPLIRAADEGEDVGQMG